MGKAEDEDLGRDSEKPRSRYRYSLSTLLVGITVVCLAAGYWRATRQYTVTSYVHVSASRNVSEDEWVGLLNQQRDLMLSDAVLKSTLNTMDASVGDTPQEQADAIADLRNRLQVSVPGGIGELIQLRVEGKGFFANRDKRLLETVLKEYLRAAAHYYQREKPAVIPELRVLQLPKVQ